MAPIGRRLAASRGVLEPIQTKRSIAGQIAELYSVVKDLAEAPVHLIGHSWGAWLSILFAVEYPEAVKKLILVGSGPLEERFVDEFRARLDGNLSLSDREELRSVRARLPEAKGKEKQRLFKRLGELSDKGYDFDRDPNGLQAEDELPPNAEINELVWREAKVLRSGGELLRCLSRLKCPVFAIHGDYDPHPAEGIREPMERLVKEFRFVIIDKCGHTPWLERQAADVFYSVLEDALEDESVEKAEE